MAGGKDIIYDVQRIDPTTYKRDADGMEPEGGLENDAKRSRREETNQNESTEGNVGNERIGEQDMGSSEMIPQNPIEYDKNSGDQSKVVPVPPLNERNPSSSGTVLDGQDKMNEVAVVEDNQSEGSSSSGNPRTGYSRGHLIMSANPGEEERWRAHRITEDYINLASDMMYPATRLAPYGYDAPSGQYPIEAITALGLLTSPLRRPTVVEKWSPYEIAIFESSIALCGKQFHEIQKIVKSKNTKEIIEFYYVWKKTAHYKVWKREYLPSNEDMDSDDD